ncbi:MAG TPA: site-specific integrase [Pyrinomonadaceae bacterium]|jgi:integrase
MAKRFYTYQSPQGKLWGYRREYKGSQLRKRGFSTKAAAETHLTQAMGDIDAAERGEMKPIKPTTLREAIKLYIDYFSLVAKNKPYSYSNNLRYVHKFLLEFADMVSGGADKDEYLRRVTEVHVQEFMLRLYARKLSKSTVMTNTGRVLGVFSFAKRRCADLGDWQPPYVSVKVERHERKYTGRIVSEQEFRELLYSLENAPVSQFAYGWRRLHEQKKETWREARDVLIMLRYTGARLNEACQMMMHHIQRDIHPEWGSSTVHLIGTKTESERDVPIHPELAEMIQRRIDDKLCDAERLFPRSRRSSFANQMGEAMREAAIKAELKYGREEKGGFTAHSFRHTFISRLAERGLPRETIMKLSGHTSIQGIEPYLHATPESIKLAAYIVTGGDGFLTGGGVNGVVQVTGVRDSAAPKPLNKRQLPPAQRISRD